MKSVLAVCRRILIAVLALLILLGGWAYWQAPSLNELRPQLEGMLAKQLGLADLHLGNLSWRWAGHVWLNAESISFAGAEKRITVDDAQLAVKLSAWDLLQGDIRPTSISLRHGRIDLHIPKAAAGERFPLPSGLLRIEDSTVVLTYGGFSNRFEHLDLLLDAGNNSLGMQMPGFNLDVAWNAQLQPEHVQARFDNLLWLPEAWRNSIRGPFGATLQLDKAADGSAWKLLADVISDDGAEVVAADGRAHLPFNKARVQAVFHAAASPLANPLDILAIDWQEVLWQSGANSLEAHGRWAEGSLQMQAQAGELQLASLAVLGMPLAEGGWRDWLAGLAGTARNLKLEVRLPQASPWEKPGMPDLKRGDVQVDVSLSDATLPLVTAGEELMHYDGAVSLSGEGLAFRASSMHLPLQAGVVHGSAVIADFDHPVFDIKGVGQVDIGRLEAWMGVNPLPQVVWKDAPAEGEFALSWPMFASAPDKGEAKLTPALAWQTEIMGRAVQLGGGSLFWAAGKGLRFEGMDAQYEGLQANFDMRLNDASAGELQILGFRLDSVGDFAAMATRFSMPIDEPAGRYTMSLHYDGLQNKAPWSFELDLKDAGWASLLGSGKKTGEAYALQANGKKTANGLTISRLQSSGARPFVSGSGELSPELAVLRMTALQAAAYSGSLSIRAPLDHASDAPLEIDVNSDFLDQRALPKDIPDLARTAALQDNSATQRKWVLRGQFKRIHWDAVSIRGVKVHFASAAQGVGRLEADALDAAQFSMREVRAFFQLGSGGRVDIRHLGAQAMGQQMNLSGTLHPEAGGGLRWTGFADISGDFSQVIKRLDASRLFDGGTVHALWSGSGVVREGMPWWHEMQGRLRLRSDDGRILEGGTMTKLLAALSLADLPGFLTGNRKDISGPGMLYKRLQLEASVQGENAEIRQLAMRASALDMAGKGSLNLADGLIDLYVAVRPLQNLDALINMIPLLRDVILGPAKSVFRKVYHVNGPLHDARVDAVSAESAGLPDSGLLEQLISLPGRWFDAGKKAAGDAIPALP
ncbi:MAG: hypothetical protein COS82_03280 [Zetaproteobacteria bacterium CG06_land_8_20_14_3_00_59_53]|nr:MAG: hypothetical protein AUK36_00515 [Zetaproteobacteria bacterium CG2_30_59_37]PIO89553.1 MAG: hypothetical protein COX56_06815 [Zetaproteobacteria bacterium CG23_combo_of_CG06-09_8_20_14_all_59_86]PIQ65785.1 MAG: hypothetical protein COV97_01750 [Zetaproteobacteria bacterium CG11_big_fil_rev_8_21_14_0_20_59_439]PIU70936.1 MAG: hypothetical protein COS82_03280 [Zetaproteobacteria bacterium CG06_land_8_20_14_3_00_59_53]PIU97089.1 MAG: hypothetical protein COS62_05110 [Zetaproteobacteria bac